MQRKPSFPVANCNIKMPDCLPNMETTLGEEENEQQQRRQQLINFGHSQWGFNNWNWSVTKQELDFVDFANGKYCVGVVAYVSISVKSLDLHRENIGYATSLANTKGMAIYKSRKCAVTNALRETLLSYGGNIATELMEVIAENVRAEVNNTVPPTPDIPPEPTPVPRPAEPKNLSMPMTRKDVNGSGARAGAPPPVARAHPMPANLPSVPRVPTVVVAPPVAAPPPVAPPVVAPIVAPPVAVRGNGTRNQNEAANVGLESMTEEEARAERKRRQRLAQEEFRQKQLLRQNVGLDDKQEINNGSVSLDRMLMDIPSQDIVIEETGKTVAEAGKRKSPGVDTTASKRRGTLSKLNIVQD